MPRFQRDEIRAQVRVWQGKCPVPSCSRKFQVRAEPWQPKGDVLEAFKGVRPKGKHVHGSYEVYAHPEYAAAD